MPSPQHDALVQLGARWLAKQGFPVVVTEIDALGSREKPDVIGFRSTCSVVIEVKVSRSDFRADARKPERRIEGTGLGTYRFYLCPRGLIGTDELLSGWGLLHAEGTKLLEIVRPKGNLWPGSGTTLEGWAAFQHVSDGARERAVLFSLARRLARGESL